MTSFNFSNQFYNPYGTFTGNWNWTNNFNTGWNFSTPTFGSKTTSTSSSESKKDTRNETYEERKARIEKKQQELAALEELNKAKSEQLKELELQQVYNNLFLLLPFLLFAHFYTDLML